MCQGLYAIYLNVLLSFLKTSKNKGNNNLRSYVSGHLFQAICLYSCQVIQIIAFHAGKFCFYKIILDQPSRN